jgi:tetratricopeptide (TPR) repeat protein
MLLYAAAFDGQGAISIQAAKDYGKLGNNSNNTHYHALTLLRFGRFDEILELTNPPAQGNNRVYWNFARGYAHLRTGSPDSARSYLDRVLATADSTDARFRFHTGEALLGVVGGILEGAIHDDAGDLDAAIASFARAVELEDGLTYDEPEPLPFAARHWLGSALLEAGRFEEAEAAYRTELDDHPLNGWSLFGLRRALTGQGEMAEETERAFEGAWARADTWLRDSRF